MNDRQNNYTIKSEKLCFEDIQSQDEDFDLETLSIKLKLNRLFKEKLNKTVNIYLRKDRHYRGMLSGVDEHNNILLSKCVEIVDKSSITIGTCILNGGCIAYIEL